MSIVFVLVVRWAKRDFLVGAGRTTFVLYKIIRVELCKMPGQAGRQMDGEVRKASCSWQQKV